MTSDFNEDLYSEKLNFVNIFDNKDPIRHKRPYYVGKAALALSPTEEYMLRYPIKYGDFNIS